MRLPPSGAGTPRAAATRGPRRSPAGCDAKIGFPTIRLRSPREGADTALWLAVAKRVERETARFWFDRKQVPTHLLKRTAEDEAERAQLWAMCVAQSGIYPG